MKHLAGAFALTLLMGLALLPPGTAQEVKNDRITKSISRALAFLRASQTANGSWSNGNYIVGYAALPGLAMLEAGVGPTDPAVLKAAKLVRLQSKTLVATYELSLAVLFLDRLGRAEDFPLIRTLALRLVAGQNAQGGWSYFCPYLTAPDEEKLLTFLRKHQPNNPIADPLLRPAHPFLMPLAKIDPALKVPLARESLTFMEPIRRDPSQSISTTPLSKDKSDLSPTPVQGPDKAPTSAPKLTIPFDPGNGAKPLANADPFPRGLDPREPVHPGEFVREILKKRPIEDFRKKGPPPDKKGFEKPPFDKFGPEKFGFDKDDNSNTQFAILGIWAARRHGLPMSASLIALDRRFRNSQKEDGGWGYKSGKNGATPSMTCVGLLGLGVSHGAFHEAFAGKEPAAKDAKPKEPMPALADPALLKGFRYLSRAIAEDEDPLDLYFLWSVERVAVMYHLKTIGQSDWYAWGSERLLAKQTPQGAWAAQGYPGSNPVLDTAMAILFLRRANLSGDLTYRLGQVLAFPDVPAVK